MLRCFDIVEQYYFHASDFDHNYTAVPPFSGTGDCIRFSIPVSDMASLMIYSGMRKCLKVFIYANVTGNDDILPRTAVPSPSMTGRDHLLYAEPIHIRKP